MMRSGAVEKEEAGQRGLIRGIYIRIEHPQNYTWPICGFADDDDGEMTARMMRSERLGRGR
jgi:glucose/arabinose dehydrogenase